MMAINEATTQLIHLQALLKDLGETHYAPTTVHTDTEAAHVSLLSENFSKRLKHVISARQCVRE